MANRKIRAELDIDGKDNSGPAFRSVALRMGQIEKQLGRFNKQAQSFNRTADQFSKKVENIERASSGISRQTAAVAEGARRVGPIIAGSVLAAGVAARAAVIDYAALDRQMSRIGNTAGSTEQDTRDAFAELQRQSKALAMPLDTAVSALDTLVSSGMSLKEAMAFLPSVLATTQASGAEVTDIANTGLKAASALQLKAGEMQRAFDLMVASGQSGQFELKDMARYIPSLANAFGRLGYKGEDGLKRLMAALQTVREDTGTAEEAADDVANVFQKMGSRETISNFQKFGIDLQDEMDKAKKKGEDTIDAFVRLSRMAVKGDLSKLPLLFSDKQVLDGMTSLITSTDRLAHFYDVLNGTDIDGTVARNNIRVLNDTQASIDRLADSYDKLKASAGRSLSTVAVPAMDSVSKALDFGDAEAEGMKKRGYGWLKRNLGLYSYDQLNDLAYEGGYRDPEWLKTYFAKKNGGLENDPAMRIVIASMKRPPPKQSSGPPLGAGLNPDAVAIEKAKAAGAPAPMPFEQSVRNFFRVPSRDDFKKAMAIDISNGGVGGQAKDVGQKPGAAPAGTSVGSPAPNGFRTPSRFDLQSALKVDVASADDAGQKVAEGGKQAADQIRESAAFFKVAGVDVGAALVEAGKQILEAAKLLQAGSARAANAAASGNAYSRPNADLGRSMAPSVISPSAQGGGGGGGGGF